MAVASSGALSGKDGAAPIRLSKSTDPAKDGAAPSEALAISEVSELLRSTVRPDMERGQAAGEQPRART